MSKYGFNAINVVFMSPLHGEQMIFTKCDNPEDIWNSEIHENDSHNTIFNKSIEYQKKENDLPPQILIPKFGFIIAMSQVGTLIQRITHIRIWAIPRLLALHFWHDFVTLAAVFWTPMQCLLYFFHDPQPKQS